MPTRSSNVHGDLNLAGVTGSGNGSLEEVESLPGVLNVGSETTLVTDVSG